MPSHANPVNWFEIPVSDMARAMDVLRVRTRDRYRSFGNEPQQNGLVSDGNGGGRIGRCIGSGRGLHAIPRRVADLPACR